MTLRRSVLLAIYAVLMPGLLSSQQSSDPAAHTMTGSMSMPMSMKSDNFLDQIEHHASAGTSAEPNSTPVPMLMSMHGNWMWMFHANVFVTDLQQSGPRGADKFFSTNWFMPMAQRRLGPGQLTLRVMLSLEPATISGRQYPLLFQQGETAFGVPIVDGQHPHDFFMEIAGLYDWKLGEKTLLSFYGAPVGDPALGPTAYPHRASAMENPVGTLGHHQEDSTHIAYNVVTAGLTHGVARVEASGFHGREPNENRWNIDGGAIDSWSTRFTLQPGQNWSGQYSYGRLVSPEALFPAENQERMTASVMYNRPFAHGNWASTAVWGRTRSLSDYSKENSYLLESTMRFAAKNYGWIRLENAGRSNELLVGEKPLPIGFPGRTAWPCAGVYVRVRPRCRPRAALEDGGGRAGDNLRGSGGAPGDLRDQSCRRGDVYPLSASGWKRALGGAGRVNLCRADRKWCAL